MPAALNHHRGGSGAPLVLLHGIGLTWLTWRPVLAALEERHDVVALDLPGFGDSPALPAGVRPTVPALADALEGELDRLGIERPHLAGNSLGGWLALELARRGRAQSVVAVSPAGMWTPRELAYTRGLLRLVYAVTCVLRPYAGSVTRAVAPRTAIFAVTSSHPWRVPAEEARRTVEAFAGSDAYLDTLDHAIAGRAEGLEEIDVPVTITWGSRDVVLLPRQGPRFVHSIRGAGWRPLPGAGHVPMWDDPPLVAATILATAERAVT